MNYFFDKMYIATIAENQPGRIIYHGEKLCYSFEDGVVCNVKDVSDSYPLSKDALGRDIGNGILYAKSLYDKFPEEFGDHIFREATLDRLIQTLNSRWTNISDEPVKIKRR